MYQAIAGRKASVLKALDDTLKTCRRDLEACRRERVVFFSRKDNALAAYPSEEVLAELEKHNAEINAKIASAVAATKSLRARANNLYLSSLTDAPRLRETMEECLRCVNLEVIFLPQTL